MKNSVASVGFILSTQFGDNVALNHGGVAGIEVFCVKVAMFQACC